MNSSASVKPRSGRLGSTVPRLWTKPLRELTPETSLGFEAIEAAKIAGRHLHPWQEWFLIHSLELALGSFSSDTFPKLRFKTVLLLVARQNGKSFIMSTRLLWRMLMWEGPEDEPALILGAAHKLGAAEEILDLTVKAMQRSGARRYIERKSNVNGNKFLELTNGARYKCEAASDDGGRGLSVTDLAFDELRQQRDWESWSALTNTTNARFSPQTIAVSNAGTAKSAVLRGLRKQGLDRIADWEKYVESGVKSVEDFANSHDTTMGLFEWSAPDDCDIHDRDGWAWANPSMGYEDENGIAYVTEEMMASKVALVGAGGDDGVPEHVFRTENLCQWVVASSDGPFSAEAIAACVDDSADFDPESPLVLAVDTSHDRSMTYFAVAGYTPAGVPLVQIIAQRAGTEWVAKTLAGGLEFTPDSVVVQGRGAPASSLIEYIEQEGTEVRACQGTDLTNSCSQFYDRVMNGTVRFTNQPALLLAMGEAVKKSLGETWAWNRAKSPVDVAPLCAATEALWGLEMLDKTPVASTAYGQDYDKWW
ncbi:terminase large subunit domain-containing protein [Glutamicibacter sp.]|uniref:terminase large subunit domain-containing protein n=1 Tax=Glutamicibacter sp. TaxID=1931995 RepID=UPI002B473C88|nr:terminase large subunit [Glutamicibacter sp.]HJX77282.1 terminase large subunit [Glutamicibacter sp.]